LQTVELKEYASQTMAEGLSTKLNELTDELSAGQKQFVCLARALLRNNRIVLMDEATANVDNETALIIQNTIALKFVGATILTIAHRLRTVIDSDKILVMHAGRVAEFASPADLLWNPCSYLSQLVEATEAEAAWLREVAFGRAALD
jgi:ABC-type multidrug transport system fused ATPase/permease subunit